MPANLALAPDLLSVIREFLDTDIVQDPGLSDDKRFNARVAGNLLAMAERELRLGPAAKAAEADRLTALVGAEGSLEEKNRRLCRAIRDRAVAGDDPQVLDHLHRTIVDALRINNPKWIGGLS
ncbi:MAG TPA: DUF6285 domain-containing protein [Candidatus Saccharimonadales bacterium]|jgi:hypothetical protein|nr:DUF6285 domain-containing protein [Candidatus Saccharimonadales bacterium]